VTKNRSPFFTDALTANKHSGGFHIIMKYLLYFASLTIALASPMLAAPELPAANIDVNIDFSSAHMFRGQDLTQGEAVVTRQSYSGTPSEWTFQPSIVYKTPVDGLYFYFGGNFSTSHRRDVDVDQRFQTTPMVNPLSGSFPSTNTDPGVASPSTIYNPLAASATAQNTNLFVDAFDTRVNTSQTPQAYIASRLAALAPTYPSTVIAAMTPTSIPNFRRDQVGMARKDEIDMEMGYKRNTKVGVLGFGIVDYSLASSKLAAAQYGTEIWISYAPPFLTDLTFKVNTDVDAGGQYYQIQYSKTIKMSDLVSVNVATGPGYGVSGGSTGNISGIKDVTSSVGVSVGGFHIGFNSAYRPNMKWFDSDPSTIYPVQLEGGSTRNDGLVADPKRANSGWWNDLVNRNLTYSARAFNPNYVYTPRQKLPKWVSWVNVGYTVSL